MHERLRYGLAPGKARPAEVGSSAPNLYGAECAMLVPPQWSECECLPVPPLWHTRARGMCMRPFGGGLQSVQRAVRVCPACRVCKHVPAGPAEQQLPAAPEAALPSANPSAQHAQPAQHTDLAEQPLSAAPETDQPVSTATPSAPSVSQQRLHSPNASAADESHASGVCLAASPAATPAEPACRRRPKTRGGRRAHAPTSN